ncbi:MAG TPA: hypothetical protein PLP19_07910 [bacterium]|nr:hypothetical protein [bacterium]HPN43398.1 hypothetical protein [bacterium]
MDIKNERKLLLEKWKMAQKFIEHEDNMTWQKFNYFIAINGILISVMITKWKDLTIPFINIINVGGIISLFGLIISLVWLNVQWRGKHFHELYIKQAKITNCFRQKVFI